ncbi:MAG: hypothetical protein CMJ83_04065 [Planctomycetes bacterium]|nr:hypothetical protein [Planctomycetota bacterium]
MTEPPLIARLLLIGGFLAVTITVPVIDGSGFWRDPEDPRERRAVENLRSEWEPSFETLEDGRWARHLQLRIADASRVGAWLRPSYFEARVGLLRDPPHRVVIGKDGWLFLARSLRHQGRSPLRLHALLREALRQKIPLGIGFIPSKGEMHPDKLPFPMEPARARLYDRLTAQVRKAKVPFVDLRAALKEAAQTHGRSMFIPSDTHTDSVGLLVLARTIAREFRLATDKRIEEFSRAAVSYRHPMRTHLGDLQTMLGVAEGSPTWRRFDVNVAELKSIDQPPLSDASAHLWIGDSFSTNNALYLPRITAEMAGWPDLHLVNYQPGWDKIALARLRGPTKPKTVVVVLSARWFRLTR